MLLNALSEWQLWCMHCFLSYSSFHFISCVHGCFKPRPKSLMSMSDASPTLWTKDFFFLSFNAFSRLCCKTSHKWKNLWKKKKWKKKPLSAKLAIVKRFQGLFQTTYFMLNPPSVPSDQTQSISRVVLKYSISAGVIWIRQRGRSKGQSWIWWLLEMLFRRSAWV